MSLSLGIFRELARASNEIVAQPPLPLVSSKVIGKLRDHTRSPKLRVNVLSLAVPEGDRIPTPKSSIPEYGVLTAALQRSVSLVAIWRTQ